VKGSGTYLPVWQTGEKGGGVRSEKG